MVWYTLLVLAVAAERVAELAVSLRNARWSLARGAVERGRGHYPAMVVLHTGLLAGAVAEVWLAGRPFVPALGWTMLAVVVAAQALRWWCIRTLGPRWNTRVLVVPGLPLVASGPYRWLRHPNYVAVVAEGVTLPLVHGAWVTALAFTALDAWLLAVRVRCENSALHRSRPASAAATAPSPAPSSNASPAPVTPAVSAAPVASTAPAGGDGGPAAEGTGGTGADEAIADGTAAGG